MGNNDMNPNYYLNITNGQVDNPYLRTLADTWQLTLFPDERQSITRQGCYVREVQPHPGGGGMLAVHAPPYPQRAAPERWGFALSTEPSLHMCNSQVQVYTLGNSMGACLLPAGRCSLFSRALHMGPHPTTGSRSCTTNC